MEKQNTIFCIPLVEQCWLNERSIEIGRMDNRISQDGYRLVRVKSFFKNRFSDYFL